MTVNTVFPPYLTFPDITGKPLEGGYIYIGEPGFEARTTPKPSWFDAEQTIPTGTASGAAIRTMHGFPMRNGSPATFYTEGDFSITVTDRNGVVIYSALTATLTIGQGGGLLFATRGDASGSAIPQTIEAVKTFGYADVADGGGTDYAIGPALEVGGFLDESNRAFEIIKAPEYNAHTFGILPEDYQAAPLINDVFEWMERRGRQGRLILSAENYWMTEGVKPRSAMGLLGAGGGQYPAAPFATSPDFIDTAKTRLVAQIGFPAGEYMLDVTPTRGDKYALQGVNVGGFLLDCNLIAEYGFRWRGVKNSQYRDILVYRPTILGAKLDTAQGAANGQTAAAGSASTITFQNALACPRDGWFVGATITATGGSGSGHVCTVTGYNGTTKVATFTPAITSGSFDGTTVFNISGECTEGNGATQFNNHGAMTVWLGNSGSARGIEVDGDGVHDVNQNSWDLHRVVHADGDGCIWLNGDTDWVRNIATYSFGKGRGLVCHGSNSTNYEGYCRQMFFDNCLFGGANLGGRTGTAQAGAATTITLDAGASAVTGYYVGRPVTITGGTGAGQEAWITAYDGATKIATVAAAWLVNPNATSTFSIPNGGGVYLLSGSYRASRFHSFTGYQGIANGSGEIWGQAGASWNSDDEVETMKGGTSGHDLFLASMDAFTIGTRSSLGFKQRMGGGQLQEAISLRHLAQGSAGSEGSSLLVYTMNAGTLGEVFRFAGAAVNSLVPIQRNGTQVVNTRVTGWAAATGTATRTTFATGSVTLPQLAERVKALIDDLTSHGLIGA